MKKITIIALILVITIGIMGNVYAAFSCNLNMQSNQTEVAKNQEFTVNINVTNIQSERGIISMGGTLEYDKDSLELVKMEGKNGWETPSEGSSYNATNGKIVIDRSSVGKKDETIFSVTFKVKEASKQNLVVTFKNITVADGTQPVKIEQIYHNIAVTGGTQNPNPQPNPDESNKPNPNPGNNTGSNQNTTNNSTLVGNSNKNTVNKNTVTKKILPKAGVNSGTLIILAVAIITIAIILVIKIRLVNKKIK